jgi:hypothetical protein
MADHPPGRSPDDDGPRQADQPARSRNHVKAPPGTTDEASVTPRGVSGRDLAGCAEPDSQRQAEQDRAAVIALTPGPDPWDRALSAIRSSIDDLGVWLAIWQARSEPDAHARRCAADAIDAADTALAELHGIRAELVTQVRQADDASAERVDRLLARSRAVPGPPE